MKFIMRNDFVIRPITNSEYLNEFGITFSEFRILERLAGIADTPWVFDSVSQLFNDVVSDFDPEDIETMIEAQTNDHYKKAILKYAIKIGTCSAVIKPAKKTVTAAAIPALA